jgi:hypothetical protein
MGGMTDIDDAGSVPPLNSLILASIAPILDPCVVKIRIAVLSTSGNTWDTPTFHTVASFDQKKHERCTLTMSSC